MENQKVSLNYHTYQIIPWRGYRFSQIQPWLLAVTKNSMAQNKNYVWIKTELCQPQYARLLKPGSLLTVFIKEIAYTGSGTAVGGMSIDMMS